MAKIQAYVSDEVTNKINAIVEARRLEGAKERDVSFSSISTMLLELGLRVYEAQMERKESAFNQMEFNKILLENVLKTQFGICKVMGMASLSPYVQGKEKFVYSNMKSDILEDVRQIIEKFFPSEHDDE
ncbi:Relaxosome protein TraM [Edwardsiella tarda]|uniref:Relaxosome protein TraM n=1 Tax=Edwardsiella tarda ATCC 15947 = NBRC 105688 TaxID=667121 RepID=A0AC61TMP8_EDWTA|nr:conjugal transfer relaxosome DNA-binding protein TraM [Edwardsiella tarda]UAL58157.1 relaxosome protein TraM [Edwardsiella tarda]UCQ01983.1 relaxosome protein TraM [Edwardsiella tarda ATCC 15947 = NBRC 105688]STE53167.1 Relaxosome protein TraM [Edwardsiella tarda]